MSKRRSETPPEVVALRKTLAKVIQAIPKSLTWEEATRLRIQRNRLGRELAALLRVYRAGPSP